MSRADIIKSYVPFELREQQPLKSIYESAGVETGSLFDNKDDVLKQMFVSTATSWGLSLWEQFLGLQVTPEQALSERRSKIISKIRGFGTVTKSMLINVAAAYECGTIEITEHNDIYKFTIKFVSEIGIPPNFTDFEEIINEVKPAHLSVDYEYTYNTYAVVSVKTHQQLTAYTYEQIRSTSI